MNIESLLELLNIDGNPYALVAVGALTLVVFFAVVWRMFALMLRRRHHREFASGLPRGRVQHGKRLGRRREKETYAAMSVTLTEEELRAPPKTMTIWIEKVPDEGQDAPPVVMLSED